MDGWLPIVFLAVILKIPVLAGMYIVWYAVKAEPETEEEPGNEPITGSAAGGVSPRTRANRAGGRTAVARSRWSSRSVSA